MINRWWLKIQYLKEIELFILLFLSIVSDIRYYKIKNNILIPFVFAGIFQNLVFYGFGGLKNSLLGLIVPVLCLILLFALRMLGAGDIKLFSAIGAIMGLKFVIYSMIFSFLSGGVIAFVIILIRKNGIQRIKHLISYIKLCICTFSIQPYTDFADKGDGAKFHFAIAIAIGSILSIILVEYASIFKL